MMLRHYPIVLAQEKVLSKLNASYAKEIGEMLLCSKQFKSNQDTDPVLGMAYLAGIVDGKRQKRARRNHYGPFHGWRTV